MKAKFGFLIPLLLFIGCTTSVPCAIETLVVASVSSTVAGALQCSDLPAIQADVKALADKTGLCPNGNQKSLDPIICGALASLVVGEASKAVPAAWGCQLTSAQASLQRLLVTACEKIPGP